MEKLRTEAKKSESLESAEFEPSREVVRTFLGVETDTFESFKRRLEGVRGHGRLWVHPFYTKQWPGTFRGKRENLPVVQEKLRSAFLDTAKNVYEDPRSSPVLIFEAVNKIPETRAIVASSLNIDPSLLQHHGMLFFPTESSSSSPDDDPLQQALDVGSAPEKIVAESFRSMKVAGGAYVEMSKTKAAERKAHFPEIGDGLSSFAGISEERRRAYVKQLLADGKVVGPLRDEYFESSKKLRLLKDPFTVALCKQLGLRSALISGAYLEGGINDKTKEPELQACAGHIAKILRDRGMPVDISHNIWPPREELIKLGFETKQTGKKSSS